MRTSLWAEFESLLPRRRRIVGTVTAHNADGTASFLLPEGVATRVRGPLDQTPPYRAFVVDGVLEGIAPSSLTVIATEG